MRYRKRSCMSVSSIPNSPPPTLATRLPSAMSMVNRRILAGVVALPCIAVLGVAAWLTPSFNGLGTHEQLHLPPCGWIAMMDMPCPTCGMTTAFAHAAHGHLLASFLAQPMGFLLALATAMTLLVCLHTAITGARTAGALQRLWRPYSGWMIAGLIVAAWMYKIASYKGWLG